MSTSRRDSFKNLSEFGSVVENLDDYRSLPISTSIGDVNIIKKINGRDEVRQHLAELGFVVGEEVRVVNELGGNLILSIKDSRIALDKTMAMRVMV